MRTDGDKRLNDKITVVDIDWSAASSEAISMLSRESIDGINLCINVHNDITGSDLSDQARRISETAHGRGLRISCITLGGFDARFGLGRPEDLPDLVSPVMDTLRSMGELEGCTLVIQPPAPHRLLSDVQTPSEVQLNSAAQMPSEVRKPSAVHTPAVGRQPSGGRRFSYGDALNGSRIILELFRSVTERFGMTLAIEAPSAGVLLSPVEVRDLVDSLFSGHIGCCVNIQAMVAAGDMSAEEILADWSELLGNRVKLYRCRATEDDRPGLYFPV